MIKLFRKLPAIVQKTILIAWAAIPLVLWLLPADFFDSGNSICLSIVILDTPCFACGLTRSIQHLLHFEWQQAAAFNRLGFIVLPLLFYIWYEQLIFLAKSRSKNRI